MHIPRLNGVFRRRASSAALGVIAVLGLGGCTITGPSLLGIAKMIYACIPVNSMIDEMAGAARQGKVLNFAGAQASARVSAKRR